VHTTTVLTRLHKRHRLQVAQLPLRARGGGLRRRHKAAAADRLIAQRGPAASAGRGAGRRAVWGARRRTGWGVRGGAAGKQRTSDKRRRSVLRVRRRRHRRGAAVTCEELQSQCAAGAETEREERAHPADRRRMFPPKAPTGDSEALDATARVPTRSSMYAPVLRSVDREGGAGVSIIADGQV